MGWKLVYYNGNRLLEGPVWDDARGILYCVAIRDNTVIAVHPESKMVRTVNVGSPVGFVVLQKDGSLIGAKKDGIFRVRIAKEGNVLKEETEGENGIFYPEPKMEMIFQPQKDERMRYNDGCMDAKGRIFADYMGDPEPIPGGGGVFCIEGKAARTLITGATVPNGMGFSPDGRYFYFIDTPARKVNRYCYHMETGEIADPVELITFTGAGSPDGMSVLPDGTLLVAEWGGGCVSRWSPEGQPVGIYRLPVTNVSSCCPGRDGVLYVTTAVCADREEPLAGGLFQIEL